MEYQQVNVKTTQPRSHYQQFLAMHNITGNVYEVCGVGWK
jgi:hypothetical protein